MNLGTSHMQLANSMFELESQSHGTLQLASVEKRRNGPGWLVPECPTRSSRVDGAAKALPHWSRSQSRTTELTDAVRLWIVRWP